MSSREWEGGREEAWSWEIRCGHPRERSGKNDRFVSSCKLLAIGYALWIVMMPNSYVSISVTI